MYAWNSVETLLIALIVCRVGDVVRWAILWARRSLMDDGWWMTGSCWWVRFGLFGDGVVIILKPCSYIFYDDFVFF